MASSERLDLIAMLCKSAGQSADADALKVLGALDLVRWHIEQLERELVEQARSGGASWAHVGSALGISRQGAWERFTRKPAARPAIELDPEWHVPL
jgi:hypothetical protein